MGQRASNNGVKLHHGGHGLARKAGKKSIDMSKRAENCGFVGLWNHRGGVRGSRMSLRRLFLSWFWHGGNEFPLIWWCSHGLLFPFSSLLSLVDMEDEEERRSDGGREESSRQTFSLFLQSAFPFHLVDMIRTAKSHGPKRPFILLLSHQFGMQNSKRR